MYVRIPHSHTCVHVIHFGAARMHAASVAHRAVLPSSSLAAKARLQRTPVSNPTATFRMAVCRLNASADTPEGLSDGCRGAPLVPGQKLPLPGDESIMKPKAHGTTETPVKPQLRWGCDVRLADRICRCVRGCQPGGGRTRFGGSLRVGVASVEPVTAPPSLGLAVHSRLSATPRASASQLQPPLCRGAHCRLELSACAAHVLGQNFPLLPSFRHHSRARPPPPHSKPGTGRPPTS